MALIGRMDEMVKDYLLFRGLSGSFKSLDSELRNEKEKGFQVDKIMELFHAYINSYDILSLREYWAFLDKRLYSRLEQVYANSIRKLEVNLLKLYVINAIQGNRSDKVSEFFEKYAAELQNQTEWKEWFILPFIKTPEEQPTFAMYFTKQWQDTFYLSLHNFLGVVIQSIPIPSILQYEDDQKKMTKLRDENSRYKQQIIRLKENKDTISESDDPVAGLLLSDQHGSGPGPSSMDLMDDFFVISQDATIQEQPQQTPKTQQIKSFIRNIGLPSSPIAGKRNSQNIPGKGTPSSVTSTSVRREEQGRQVQAESHPSSSSVPVIIRQKSREAPTQSTRVPKTKAVDLSHVQEAPVSSEATSSVNDPRPEPPQSATEKRKSHGESTTPTKARENRMSSLRRRLSKLATKMTERPESPKTRKKVLPPSTHDQSLMETVMQSSDNPFLLLSQEEFAEHHSAVSHCCYSSNGHLVATADVDGVVKVWTLQPSPVTVATTISKSIILSMIWVHNSDRLLLLGTKAGTIRVFDVKEKKTLKEITTDMAYPRIVSLSCSPTGATFVCSAAGKVRPGSSSSDASGPRMGKLTIWDLKTMTSQKHLPLTPGPIAVNCLCFNHNGGLLLAGSADGYIRLFDVQKGECITSWASHKGEVYSLLFSLDETSCFSMGSDGKFLRWNMNRTGKLLSQLPVHSGACGPFLLTGAAGYRQVQTPKGKLFAFDTTGHHVLTCDQSGGMIYKVDKQTGLQRTLSLGGHKTPVTCVDWSTAEDCKMCVTCSMDGKVRVSTLLSQ